MIYFVGNQRHADEIKPFLPQSVAEELIAISSILDKSYGEDRDFLHRGGFVIVVNDARDFSAFQGIVNYRCHPAEWTSKVDNYITSLYLLGDDFSVVLFAPCDIVPNIILNELRKEENVK